jgi:Cu(I)/Ag(I) efflux system membrane fusion protein
LEIVMLRMQFLPAAIRLAVLVISAAIGLASCGGRPSYRIEPVAQEILVGAATRIVIRVVDARGNPLPASSITIQSARLDMGPDDMAAMVAPLKQLEGATPEGLAFEADVAMPGRWALTITLAVEGSKAPVTGKIVLTAVEYKAELRSPAGTAQRKILYYRNPMGLADISPTPKKDQMGMDYIPVYSDEATDTAGAVRISPEKIQRAGIRTEIVKLHALNRTLRAVGTVVHDESRLAVVTAKFDGFVDEMMVSTVGVTVEAGQPLLRVWVESKEILQKEADYLVALRTGSEPLYIRDARNNLRLFGVPAETIRELERTRRPVRTIIFAAPFRGRVIEKPALKGMRFAAGDTLFKVADHSAVWVMTQVPERELGMLTVGQSARITLTADRSDPIAGKVALIYPELDLATRTAMVRIEVANERELIKIGQYADVEIDTPLSDEPIVAVRESAVIDSGTRRAVFVAKDGGVFEPRDVTLGRRGGGLVEVRSGLAEGERIVVSGNFLIDAESNLHAALAAFGAPQAPK